jgi:hypothetical protein
MKTLQIAAALAACLSVAAVAGPGKNAPEALADVVPDGCQLVQIAPFGTSLLASWSWENGTVQTKFGGDAVYMVVANDYDPFEVEFELVQYEQGMPADAYPGEMVYRCSNAQTEEIGSCNGSVLGVRSALREAAADYLGVLPEEIETISATLEGVYVKAMNPGPGSGRQNYPRVNVCEELTFSPAMD